MTVHTTHSITARQLFWQKLHFDTDKKVSFCKMKWFCPLTAQSNWRSLVQHASCTCCNHMQRHANCRYVHHAKLRFTQALRNLSSQRFGHGLTCCAYSLRPSTHEYPTPSLNCSFWRHSTDSGRYGSDGSSKALRRMYFSIFLCLPSGRSCM